MANRKSMSETAKLFLKTGDVESEPGARSADAAMVQDHSPSIAISSSSPNPDLPVADPLPPVSDLRQELLGEATDSEATIRFTVDLPKSLHRRLQQLSLDSQKPKTELVRIMVRRMLDELEY